MSSSEVCPRRTANMSCMSCVSGITKLRHCIFPFTRPEVAINWDLENSDVVLHDTSEANDAAVVTGQMSLDVNVDFVQVDGFSATLSIHVQQKRPFHEHCESCQSRRMELQSWSFISSAKILPRGQRAFPFSFALDGSQPTSMDNELVSIRYEYTAVAHLNHNLELKSGSGSSLKFEKVLDVQRDVPEPELPFELDHHFPPLKFRTQAQLKKIVYPGRPNRIYMRMQGPKTDEEKLPRRNEVWMLRKVGWRLEETVRAEAPACKQHTSNPSSDEEEWRSHSSTRTIEERDLYSGWKDTADGNIEMELEFGSGLRHVRSGKPRYSCDATAWEGVEVHVTHALVVELAVCWERADRGASGSCSSGGQMLRMRYPVVMADQPWTGAGWEVDAPPRYEDVPPEPPCYSGRCSQ